MDYAICDNADKYPAVQFTALQTTYRNAKSAKEETQTAQIDQETSLCCLRFFLCAFCVPSVLNRSPCQKLWASAFNSDCSRDGTNPGRRAAGFLYRGARLLSRSWLHAGRV